MQKGNGVLMQSGKVVLLPASVTSLARGLPPAPPGTLFALGDHGGISVPARSQFMVVFGRNEPDVHVCVGENDRGVSRRQGQLYTDGRRWIVRNLGKAPIRFPGIQLLLRGQEQPLPVAYTPLFIRTGPGREHLLEVRVAGIPAAPSTGCHGLSTHFSQPWDLSERERLVLVVLGQRYLRHEPYPAPLTRGLVAKELAALQPRCEWTEKCVDGIVGTVRARLSNRGVGGLTRDEVGEPVGNSLNHNLLIELLLSATLVPSDLRLLD
jgi:hypothetical protein